MLPEALYGAMYDRRMAPCIQLAMVTCATRAHGSAESSDNNLGLCYAFGPSLGAAAL